MATLDNKPHYTKDAQDLVKINIQRGMNITNAVKDMCIDLGLEYGDSIRKCYSNILGSRGSLTSNSIESSEQFLKAKKHKISSKKKRFIITYAQNETPVHRKFLSNMEAYSEFLDAEIIAITGRYKNPTSIFKDADRENNWDKAVEPYLTANRHHVHQHVMVLGDVKTQPTAINPLSGLAGISGLESCVIGHPKIALQSVPVLEGYPNKLLVTTGACTVANYTDSSAGKKGEFHHQLGFCLVEVEDEEVFYIRQVSASEDGSFYDLFYHISNSEVKENTEGIPAIVLGDYHAGEHCIKSVQASLDMMNRLQPEITILHDIYDGKAVNHHELKDPFTLMQRENNGELDLSLEIDNMLEELSKFINYNPVVVSANHNTFLDRWLCNTDWRKSSNKYQYLKYAMAIADGKCPKGVVPYMIDERFGDKVKCLGYNDSFRVLGWELGQHGDLGVNGSRGSANQFKNLNTKIITGHSHSPSRNLGHICVGTLTKLRVDYNKGASSWLNSNAIIHPDGKAQQIHIIKGKYTTLTK